MRAHVIERQKMMLALRRSWDLVTALSVLRNGTEGERCWALRNIHNRLLHAPVTRMTALLRNAGVAKECMDLVPDIVDTCHACRNLIRPGAGAVATVRQSTHLNECVQFGLLFVESEVVAHLIDECTRWAATKGSTAETPTRSSAASLRCGYDWGCTTGLYERS